MKYYLFFLSTTGCEKQQQSRPMRLQIYPYVSHDKYAEFLKLLQHTVLNVTLFVKLEVPLPITGFMICAQGVCLYKQVKFLAYILNLKIFFFFLNPSLNKIIHVMEK